METRERQELIAAALQVRERAYAPYSRFSVGAAVRTAGGGIFAGCNVENASYGLTLCAERVAVVQAVSAGQCQLLAVAVAAAGPAAPCGACRQFLAEFGPEMAVLLVDPERPEHAVELNLRELLPYRFVLREPPGPPHYTR